jgi:hypothetical protein
VFVVFDSRYAKRFVLTNATFAAAGALPFVAVTAATAGAEASFTPAPARWAPPPSGWGRPCHQTPTTANKPKTANIPIRRFIA